MVSLLPLLFHVLTPHLTSTWLFPILCFLKSDFSLWFFLFLIRMMSHHHPVFFVYFSFFFLSSSFCNCFSYLPPQPSLIYFFLSQSFFYLSMSSLVLCFLFSVYVYSMHQYLSLFLGLFQFCYTFLTGSLAIGFLFFFWLCFVGTTLWCRSIMDFLRFMSTVFFLLSFFFFLFMYLCLYICMSLMLSFFLYTLAWILESILLLPNTYILPTYLLSDASSISCTCHGRLFGLGLTVPSIVFFFWCYVLLIL